MFIFIIILNCSILILNFYGDGEELEGVGQVNIKCEGEIYKFFVKIFFCELSLKHFIFCIVLPAGNTWVIIFFIYGTQINLQKKCFGRIGVTYWYNSNLYSMVFFSYPLYVRNNPGHLVNLVRNKLNMQKRLRKIVINWQINLKSDEKKVQIF